MKKFAQIVLAAMLVSSCDFDPWAGRFDKALLRDVEGCFYFDDESKIVLKIDKYGQIFTPEKIDFITFISREDESLRITTKESLVFDLERKKIFRHSSFAYFMNLSDKGIMIHSSLGDVGDYMTFSPILLQKMDCGNDTNFNS